MTLNTFIKFKTVRTLNLSDNVIETIPESVEKMSMLKRLDVSGNCVRFWPKVSPWRPQVYTLNRNYTLSVWRACQTLKSCGIIKGQKMAEKMIIDRSLYNLPPLRYYIFTYNYPLADNHTHPLVLQCFTCWEFRNQTIFLSC